MARGLSTAFLLVGAALVGAAALEYFVSGDASRVVIEEPERELPDVVAGQPIEVVFHISNPTRSTVRVVGLADC